MTLICLKFAVDTFNGLKVNQKKTSNVGGRTDKQGNSCGALMNSVARRITQFSGKVSNALRSVSIEFKV